MTTLRERGEAALIRELARLLPTRDDVLHGVSDDAAVVATRDGVWDWLLTSDPVVEGVHYPADARPEQVGHKAMGRVLSDIAAMGGEPLWALIDLSLPPETPLEWVQSVYRGAGALAERYGMAIVGGDVCAAAPAQFHVFGVGRVRKGGAVLRSGAAPGDFVYVTGALGGSRAGKHLAFEPRVAEGQWLGECGWANAMIDVTDGLATDLRHLLERSAVGAEVQRAALPVSDAARSAPGEQPPWERALRDGEDFELLFTLAPDNRPAFETEWRKTFDLPVSCIGVVNCQEGVLTLLDEEGRPVCYREMGYDHFQS